MADVTLILQPAADRSRSMVLYADRLAAHAPAGQRWNVLRLPTLPLDGRGRVAELVAAPGALAGIRDGVAHVVDHAHAAFVHHVRVPSIVTVHDLIPWKAHRGLYPAAASAHVPKRVGWWFRWNMSAIRKARVVVTPSMATADAYREHFGAARIHVVPHGLEPEFITPTPAEVLETVRGKLGWAANRPLVVHVSNGFFYKNDRGVLEAMAALVDRFPGLVLVRLGPKLPAALEELVPPGRVLYFRPRSALEIAALYRLATVVVSPSWDEGFGWPPVEAMACGCPVVTSACGSLAETAAPAGLVVDPTDPASLSAGVARVLTEPALREDLVGRGLEHSALYRWDRASRQMVEVYEEVAACA